MNNYPLQDLINLTKEQKETWKRYALNIISKKHKIFPITCLCEVPSRYNQLETMTDKDYDFWIDELQFYVGYDEDKYRVVLMPFEAADHAMIVNTIYKRRNEDENESL